MKAKTKLIAILMATCLVITLGVIGILAVKTLNMKIGGDVRFFADGISFTVGPGNFYEDNGSTLYNGITTQTGILQGFSMDTDTKLTDVSEAIETWTGLELELDTRGDAILKFNVANDMDDKELYILFTIKLGENTNDNMNIVASTSEKIAPSGNKDISIKFDILDMDLNAGLEGFEIGLTFSEPVAVGSSGVVENISNTKYTNAKYNIDESSKTASVVKSSSDVAGEVVVMDRVYNGEKEYIVTEIGMGAFTGCSEITSVVIPNGVTKIGQSAFDSCENLVSVFIPDSVTQIDGSAFSDCYSLIDIKLPSGLKAIPYALFYNCYSLTSVEIPASVETIDYEVFCNCDSLEYVIFNSPVPPTCVNMEYGNIFDHADNCSIYVPAGSIQAYKTAPYWREYADRIYAI